MTPANFLSFVFFFKLFAQLFDFNLSNQWLQIPVRDVLQNSYL